jgi:hypothetical protein
LGKEAHKNTRVCPFGMIQSIQGFPGPFWTTNGEIHGIFDGIFATRLVDILTTAITTRLS